MRFNSRRPNPVFSDEYRALVSVLTRARNSAGLSQRALAGRLGRSASHIQRIECGQRRVDLLEFCLMARALQAEPTTLLGEVLTAIGEEIEAAKRGHA